MANIKHSLRLFRVAFFLAFDSMSVLLLTWWLKFTNTKPATRKYKYGFVFTSDIGDMVIFSMFLLVFLKKVDSRCVVITSEVNARLAAPFFPGVEFLVIDYSKYKTSLVYRFQKTREIRGISLVSCIVPMRSRDYCVTDSIAKKIRKDTALVFTSDESNRIKLEAYIEKYIYDEWLDDFSVDTHELMAYKILLDKFGVDFQAELASVIPAFRAKARETKNLLPPDLPKVFVLMNVGASQLYKRWPIENYIALAKRIYAESGIVSLFIGGPSERNLQGSFKSYPFIIDLILKTGNFEVLKNIIVNAKYVVSNDTFVSHYSVVLGVPTVNIAGGGHFGRFLPYPKDVYPMFANSYTIFKQMPCFHCKWVCNQLAGRSSNSPFPCVSEISVEDVFAVSGKIGAEQTIKEKEFISA